MGHLLRKKVIYLASPYTHPDAEKRRLRYREAMEWCARFMKKGHVVFSPIVHSHPLAEQCDMPTTWEFWRGQDEAYLHVIDELWVLTLPGWRTSTGVQAEIKIAEDLGKVVRYIDLATGERVTNPTKIV